MKFRAAYLAFRGIRGKATESPPLFGGKPHKDRRAAGADRHGKGLAMTVENQGHRNHKTGQAKPALLNRSALAITLTEDSAMAAAAITGDRRMPKPG